MSGRSNSVLEKADTVPQARSALIKGAHGIRLQRKCACGGNCQSCGEKKHLLRAARPGAEAKSSEVPPLVHEVLATPGQPLSSSVRTFMEPRFKQDFGKVRVHTDERAAASARAVDALAYTVGNDIVFDRGQYQPDTERGRHLLAHELAHTVQQQGATSKEALTFDSLGATSLEREADAAAASVMSTPTAGASSPFIGLHPATATLSRREATAKPSGEEKTGKDFPTSILDRERKLAANPESQEMISWHSGSTPKNLVIYVDTFYLPRQKAPFDKEYDKAAKSGVLQATLSLSDSKATQLLQRRDASPTLQNSWLQTISDGKPNILCKWKALSEDDFPKAAGTPCQIDHIIELQVGGGNSPENLAPLGDSLNEESGRLIRQQLVNLANAASILAPKLGLTSIPEEVTLRFKNVVVAGGTPLPSNTERPHHCHELPEKLKSPEELKNSDGEPECPTESGAALPSDASKFEFYPIKAGSMSTSLDARKEVPSETNLDVSQGRNRAANQLILGLRLTSLRRNPGVGKDLIDATIDERTKTRLPIALKEFKAAKATAKQKSKTQETSEKEPAEPLISFDVLAPGNTLQLNKRYRNEHLLFTYPYLSEGYLKLQHDPATGLKGDGELTPSVPLLKAVAIKVSADFGKGEFSGSATFPADKLTPPFKGLRFTQSSLGVNLAPEFSPHGILAFEMGPQGKPWLDGTLTATADKERGFVATGEMNAHLPGVDKAKGQVEYANHQWTGELLISSSQIALPYVKEGSLRMAFAGDEKSTSVQGSGSVTVEPPGFGPIELRIEHKDGRWVYQGTGSVDVPSLGLVKFTLTHDGTRLTGDGSATITRGGLSGQLDVGYDSKDGISGDGTLSLKKDKIQGSLKAKLRQGRTLSGHGDVKYAFTPNLEGIASVELTEAQILKVDGGIQFPKPISLFKQHEGSYNLLKHRLDIPIVGLSVGPVSIGLIARISGSLDAGYSIGPGTLKGISATAGAQFNLQDLHKSSFSSANLKGTLDIPAQAGLSLSVRGGLGLSAGLASVTGGLTAIGSARLVGGLTTMANIQYTQGRFILDLTPSIKTGLVLSLGLTADVTAEAGVGFVSYEKKWLWNLASHQWASGSIFGLTAPIHYDSAASFKPPASNQIQWILPNIDIAQLVASLVKIVRK